MFVVKQMRELYGLYVYPIQIENKILCFVSGKYTLVCKLCSYTLKYSNNACNTNCFNVKLVRFLLCTLNLCAVIFRKTLLGIIIIINL